MTQSSQYDLIEISATYRSHTLADPLAMWLLSYVGYREHIHILELLSSLENAEDVGVGRTVNFLVEANLLRLQGNTLSLSSEGQRFLLGLNIPLGRVRSPKGAKIMVGDSFPSTSRIIK